MSNAHKFKYVINAWVEGKTVESKKIYDYQNDRYLTDSDKWISWNCMLYDGTPPFNSKEFEWRIKPNKIDI